MQAQISHNALQDWWQQTNTQRWTVTRQLWVNVFNLLGVIQSVYPVITSLYVDGYHGYHGYQPPTKETPQEMKSHRLSGSMSTFLSPFKTFSYGGEKLIIQVRIFTKSPKASSGIQTSGSRVTVLERAPTVHPPRADRGSWVWIPPWSLAGSNPAGSSRLLFNVPNLK